MLEGHTEKVNYIISLRKTNELISASDDKMVRLWNLKSLTSVILSSHSMAVQKLFYFGGQIISMGIKRDN